MRLKTEARGSEEKLPHSALKQIHGFIRDDDEMVPSVSSKIFVDKNTMVQDVNVYLKWLN